ncbi:5-hydroxytryptamine receptor 1 [Melipona quadrifasciata]|uniref:5-hydroxytryptamine receptor 1 n=1 Tax=Melipona quadrifasciata TaxID=166423 RepID=A0A0M9A5J3_9HYME|nr:5-hydroxytryptamine receptor 1 [Melipona quadrifasciata]
MEGKDAITTEGTLLLNLTTIATRDADGFLRGFPGKNSPYTVTQLKDFVCPQAILIALVLGSIIVGTVIGNILVCVAVFLVRKLRRPCNYLLVSLAVSDLCVALLVMPMALLYEISGNWSFGAIMCDLWVSFDVLSCTASILNLCMISVDRFCAITKPLKYGVKRTPRRMIIYVSLVWLGAACISLPPLLIMGNEHTYSETGPSHCVVCQNFFYQIYATLGSFYIPLFVMIQISETMNETKMQAKFVVRLVLAGNIDDSDVNKGNVRITNTNERGSSKKLIKCSGPTIPRLRVSNTRLAQAASGCAPSVEVLPIFDVKQAACGTPLGGGVFGASLSGWVEFITSVLWGKESLPSAPLDESRQQQ